MTEELRNRQPKVLKILENAVLNDRISHAYIFSGAKGTYKREMAYHLALMLYLGTNPDYNSQIAHQILNNSHLNVFYIEPVLDTVKKEQILALQEEFSKTKALEGPRIYIIDKADSMSVQAMNSLLKFIEEPTSEDTYGILLTENIEAILPTIKSRSIILDFMRVKEGDLKEELIKSGIDIACSNYLAYLVNNLDLANKLLEDERFNDVKDTFEKYINQLFNKQKIKLFYKANQDIFYIKENVVMFLDLLEGFYRDLLEYKVAGKVLHFNNLENEVKEISERYSEDFIIEAISKILDVANKVKYYVNISLNLNKLFIDLS